MTLTQLRYLVAIADHRFNISRAAAALHTSQPGISRQIRLLEQQLGAAILTRSRNRITGLTPQGREALGQARRILKEVEHLRMMSKDSTDSETGSLTIATQHSYAISILPAAVSALHKRYPGVSVAVQQAGAGLAMEMVRYGDADLAITMEPPPPAAGLVGLHIDKVPLLLIVSTGHPLLKKRLVSLEDILAYPIIGPTSYSSTDWGVRRVFYAQGLEMRPSISVMNAGVMQAYVAAGAGIAIVPASLPRTRGIRAIDVGHLFRPNSVTAVLNPHRPLPTFLYEFISMVAPSWSKTAVDKAIGQTASGSEVAVGDAI